MNKKQYLKLINLTMLIINNISLIVITKCTMLGQSWEGSGK